MFECALFGITKEKLPLDGDAFRRIETIYEAGGRKAVVFGEKKKTEVCFYEIPDRNKQRGSVAREVRNVELQGDHMKFLEAIGYKKKRTNAVEGLRYYRSGYTVELSRLRKPIEMLDSSEEEELMEKQPEVPESLFEYYLVKVFVLIEDIGLGEEIINTAFVELGEIVKLTKPTLAIF